ncbi:MAG: hypothetical protein AAFY02_15135 [Pseudomonadota bacterium]
MKQLDYQTSKRTTWLIIGLFGLWIFLFGWSFVDFTLREPSGSGFVRGVNRLGGFLAWQVGAFLVGAGLFAVSYLQPSGLRTGIRRLTRLPLYLSALLWVLIVIAGITLFLLEKTQQSSSIS